MAIGKKVVDLSDFGYNEPVVFKELTLGDAADIAVEISMETKKSGGEISEAVVNIIVLEKLIFSAPFKHDKQGLRDLPLTTAIYILEQAQSMLDPLVKRMSRFSNTTTGEERHPTEQSQNILTDTNFLEGDSPANK